MKKIILGIALAALSLSANPTINIGVASATVDENTGTGYTIGIGGETHYNSGLLVAIDMNYDSATINSISVQTLGSDVKVGYLLNEDIGIYLIGSAIYQDFDQIEGYGIGGGIGAQYVPLKHLGFAVDYKQYSIVNELNDYNCDTVKVYMKIIF